MDYSRCKMDIYTHEIFAYIYEKLVAKSYTCIHFSYWYSSHA